KQGISPIQEPGLNDLMEQKTTAGHLHFTPTPSDISDADIIWITYDTPVDDEDRADTAFVTDKIEALFPHLKEGSILLVSSQLPVGSVASLEKKYCAAYKNKPLFFACSPENLRLGHALHVFMEPDRVIIGISDERAKPSLLELF